MSARTCLAKDAGYKMRGWWRLAVASASVALSYACATSQVPQETKEPSRAAPREKKLAGGTDVEITAASLDANPPVGADLTIDLPGGEVGIRRAALARIQRAGPHWLLQRVKVRPKLRRGVFVGWRVISYAGPGRLAVGDVVRRINGRSVERPEQFIEVWNGMTKQDRFEVELIRSGKKRRYSFPLK